MFSKRQRKTVIAVLASISVLTANVAAMRSCCAGTAARSCCCCRATQPNDLLPTGSVFADPAALPPLRSCCQKRQRSCCAGGKQTQLPAANQASTCRCRHDAPQQMVRASDDDGSGPRKRAASPLSIIDVALTSTSAAYHLANFHGPPEISGHQAGQLCPLLCRWRI